MAKTQKKKPATSRPASRRGRAEELRKRRERRSIRNRMLFAGVLLVLVGVVLFTAVTRESGDSGAAIESVNCRLDSEFDGAGRDHIPNPTYEVNPPAGGDHTPAPAQPGFYRGGREIPSDGQLVHAMEHGFVVLWHKPDLPAADMQKIEALSDRFGRELIVVPRRSLGGPVAVTAWHKRLLCGAIDAGSIAAFVEEYADKGPEKGFL